MKCCPPCSCNGQVGGVYLPGGYEQGAGGTSATEKQNRKGGKGEEKPDKQADRVSEEMKPSVNNKSSEHKINETGDTAQGHVPRVKRCSH